MRDVTNLRETSDEQSAMAYDPFAARQQQLLRSLGALLWEIAGNRKPSQQKAAGLQPAADEGGLGADPKQSSFPS